MEVRGPSEMLVTTYDIITQEHNMEILTTMKT
jgi:hypothetical protein